MGSFDYTCALSGLPIRVGTPVRYMLLTQNPYHRGKAAGEPTCGASDIWFPRTFPLRGEYNDYGAVENLQEGPQADTWAAGFKVDLCEKGWGDNSCHDVPARKDMPLSGLLAAIGEGRIHVRQDVGRHDDITAEVDALLAKAAGKKPAAKGKARVPNGIPTRTRVERVAAALGYKMAASYRDGLLVNRVDENTVRVRSGDFATRDRTLATLRDQLASTWAGAVCCGTGSYSDDAELLLRPLPGVRPRSKKERRAALCVSHAMIREDVWQAVCGLTLSPSYGSPMVVKDEIDEVRELWEKSTAKDVFRFTMRHEGGGSAGDEIPFTVGLGTHWWAMVDAWNAGGKVSDAERDDFIQTAGQLAFVRHWMSATRYQWRPSCSCGPQFGEWAAHVAMLDAFGKIAATEAAEDAKNRED